MPPPAPKTVVVVDPEDLEVGALEVRAPGDEGGDLELEDLEPGGLDGVEVGEQGRQVQDPEADVSGLVALEVGHEVRQHRLDPRHGHRLEQGHRHRLDDQLHPEELVRESVRRLGGEIKVTSKVDVGSTFTVWIPPLESGDESASAPAASSSN